MAKNNHLSNMDKSIWSEIILQGMPEIAYVFNGDGRLVRWNKNVETILGYSKEELENKPVLDFIAPKYREEVGEVFFGIYENHKDAKVEYKILTKSGKQIPYLGSGSYACVGGEDYIIGQAVNISKLKTIEKALKNQIEETNRLKDELQTENISLKARINKKLGFSDIIAETDSMVHLLDEVSQVANKGIPLILQGETGTGKTLLANTIHKISQKKNSPYINVNCVLFKPEALKVELFGAIERTSFGVVSEKPGKLEMAHSGIIVLDNLHLMPKEIQLKLLQFLENEGEYVSPSGNRKIKTDVRIIATLSNPVSSYISKNQLSKTLLLKLNAIVLEIPPLRSRQMDIPLLAYYFISYFNKKYNRNIKKITKKALNMLKEYHWPGNIKELKNIMEQAVLLSKNNLLKVPSLEKIDLSTNELFIPLDQMEKEYISKVLNTTNWRISGPKGAAKILKIHPETLRSKLKKLKITKS